MSPSHAARGRIVLAGTLLAVALTFRPALAGPPLVSDDPGLAGEGELQVIFAATAREDLAGDDVLAAPLLDVTWGVHPRLDLLFVGSHDGVIDGGDYDSPSLPLSFGAKLELWNRESIVAAFTPTFTFDARGTSNRDGLFPLQLEWQPSAWRSGIDLGYAVVNREADRWSAAWYGGLMLWDRYELLAEIVAGGQAEEDLVDDVDAEVSLGLDAALSPRWHLLTSLGTGLHSSRGPRSDWRAYLGLQLLTPVY